jgi:hypothetical protein
MSPTKDEVTQIDNPVDSEPSPDLCSHIFDIAKLAREATQEAVRDLHAKGISTYGEREGISHETKPNGEKVAAIVNEVG